MTKAFGISTMQVLKIAILLKLSSSTSLKESSAEEVILHNLSGTSYSKELPVSLPYLLL